MSEAIKLQRGDMTFVTIETYPGSGMGYEIVIDAGDILTDPQIRIQNLSDIHAEPLQVLDLPMDKIEEA